MIVGVQASCVLAQYAPNGQPVMLNDICKTFYTPAFTSYQGKTEFYGLGTFQYNSIENSNNLISGIGVQHESRYIVDASAPIYIRGKHRLGIGLNYSGKKNNFEHMEDARVNIAYRLPLGERRSLQAGVNVDLINQSFDYPALETYGFFVNNYYPPFKQSFKTMNAGAGIVYQSQPRNFYLGISLNNLVPFKMPIPAYKTTLEYTQKFFLMSGIDMVVHPKLTLKPSIFLYSLWGRYTLQPALVAEYKKKFIMGINYQSMLREGGVRVGYKLGPASIQYAYNIALSRMMNIVSGRHEIALTYQLGN